MLSKNNNRELQRKIDDRQDRFTLRKLSIGVASVLLGSFVMGTQLSQTAYASNDNSTTPQASEGVPTNSNGSSSTNPSLVPKATPAGSQLPQTGNQNPTAANESGDSQAPNTQQASITDVPDYPNTNEIIPQNQYIFDQFHLTDNKYQPLNRLITLATDRNKPGENLYYYITDDQYTQQYSNGTIKDGENQTYEDSYGGPQEMQTYEYLYGDPKIKIYNFGKNGISVNELTGNYGLALTFGYGKYQAMIKENPNPYAEDNVARAWGDTMPEKVTQTIKYVNGKTGEEIPGIQPYKQTGLTGQVYSAGKNAQIVVKGYYLVNGSRANGTISQFNNGETYINQWVDTSGRYITEEWNQISPDGKMQCNIYINGQQQHDPKNYDGIVYPSSQSSKDRPTSLRIQIGNDDFFYFPNPYVEPTQNIELKYLPLGKIIPVLPNREVIPDVPQPQYQNDSNDPTGVKPDEPVPDNPGYTPQEKTVTPKDPGKDTQVIYTKNKTPQTQQSAHLVIIDRADANNQKTLANYDVSGLNGSQINFAGANAQLTTYLNQGYKFDSNEGAGMSGDAQQGFTYPEFDNDTETDQNFKIYLTHQTKDVNQTAKATAQVHYEMADGSTAPADSPTQTVTWTKTDTVDKVDGHTVKEGDWSQPQGSFKDVKSPQVAGYTPDTDNVSFQTPVRGQNQVVDVIYTKNPETPATQKAVVIYQDVNDPAHLVQLDKSNELTGNAGDAINYSTADTIANLEKEGYVLVSNGFDPAGNKPNFDNVNDNTQTFYVNLKHGIQPVNPTNPGIPDQPINPEDPRPNKDQPKYP
ncbi:hypothetical protein DN439_08765, partial [Lactobacillus reuteri]|uniref:mucin-binding protein n=1 Tax=Limosilactobacillus reuteri TaxID=1598 RepID=UPI00128DFA9D